ncbi:MAG: linear amide C-N hydrolase [Planctomycetes bacterium]|nr:linear amide C-N hydrolase [Planctomycetota bacterium]HPY75596.1 linear amide C-N hydrolase [Planctomycetota bacterium]
MKKINYFIILWLISSCVFVYAQTKKNPAIFLKTEEQQISLDSIKNLDNGLFYEMDYIADYKLDLVLDSNIQNVFQLAQFLQKELLTENQPIKFHDSFGCSSFSVKTKDNHVLYGRNFDYNMKMTAILIRITPKNGYKSIGLADVGWIGYDIGNLDDGKTDLSMLVGTPYMIMDGMNEKGFAISVLQLNHTPTQQKTGKKAIMTSTMLRLLIDRAATVDEAIALLKNYDMYSAMPDSDFHYLLSDASGKTVVIEYCNNEMFVLDNTFVTNFYLHPSMNKIGGGYQRYEILQSILNFNKNRLNHQQAMNLLDFVSQDTTKEVKSKTQWSAVYDLTAKSLSVAIRGNYEKIFHFSLEK